MVRIDCVQGRLTTNCFLPHVRQTSSQLGYFKPYGSFQKPEKVSLDAFSDWQLTRASRILPVLVAACIVPSCGHADTRIDFPSASDY